MNNKENDLVNTNEAKEDIRESSNDILSKEQISASNKTIFIAWLLSHAHKNPDKFPEKDGRIKYSYDNVPLISKEEILLWHNTNRDWDIMTSKEFDVIISQIQWNGTFTKMGDFYGLVWL